MGFEVKELIFLAVLVTLGNELFLLVQISRAYHLLLVFVVCFFLVSIRKTLGELFLSRMIRFQRLPSRLVGRNFKESDFELF